jgi:hypothetical protein
VLVYGLEGGIVGDGAVAESEPPGMSDALARGLVLDNIGGLEKLLDLILGQRGFVGCMGGQRNYDASQNSEISSRRIAGQFPHGGGLTKLAPTVPRCQAGGNPNIFRYFQEAQK